MGDKFFEPCFQTLFKMSIKQINLIGAGIEELADYIF